MSASLQCILSDSFKSSLPGCFGCPMRRSCAWGCFLSTGSGAPCAGLARGGISCAERAEAILRPPAFKELSLRPTSARLSSVRAVMVLFILLNSFSNLSKLMARTLKFETRPLNRGVRNQYSSVHIDQNVIIDHGRALPFPLEVAAVSSAGL